MQGNLCAIENAGITQHKSWFGTNYFCPLSVIRHCSVSHSVNQKWICKIWDFRGGDYEHCRLMGYENPFRTSQDTYYFSATESSRLMLCKISDFHGGDYEECRLLGYKNPVRTSQDTYYCSPAESSRVMLCKISDFHGGDYEECHLLGC
jgi:hypothetical protein